jgi:hypothetical protein
MILFLSEQAIDLYPDKASPCFAVVIEQHNTIIHPTSIVGEMLNNKQR